MDKIGFFPNAYDPIILHVFLSIQQEHYGPLNSIVPIFNDYLMLSWGSLIKRPTKKNK